MKKRVLPLFLGVVMLLSISAQAGIARSPVLIRFVGWKNGIVYVF